MHFNSIMNNSIPTLEHHHTDQYNTNIMNTSYQGGPINLTKLIAEKNISLLLQAAQHVQRMELQQGPMPAPISSELKLNLPQQN